MQYATSIRYGGEIFKASDVDYLAYKHLGLLCPICKSPVFLQKESFRKSASVTSHFKHFSTLDPELTKNCELKVKKYDQNVLNKKSAESRNQRLKVLQQYFWRMFTTNPRLTNYQKVLTDTIILIKKSNEIESGLELTAFKEFFKFWRHEIIESQSDSLQLCRQMSSFYVNQQKDPEHEDLWQSCKWLSKFRSEVDKRMHELICEEVFLFLLAKSSRDLFFKCFVLSHACTLISKTKASLGSKDKGELDYKNQEDRIQILAMLAILIVQIAWADEFKKYDNNSK